MADDVAARMRAAFAAERAAPTPPGSVSELIGDAAEPLEPGWYAYSGGRQTIVFYRHSDAEVEAGHPRWHALASDGTASKCEWGYIEQCLSVWDLVPLVPSRVTE